MISSMTGFGRSEFNDGNRKLSVELKSVNHKYLDLNIKMPRKFNAFEAKIRKTLNEYAVRGKIDIFILYKDMNDSGESLNYNSQLAKEYFDAMLKIQNEFCLQDDIRSSTIARMPDVLTLEESEVDEDELWELLLPVLNEAFSRFRESREIEGESLKENIFLKLGEMSGYVDFIEEKLPLIISEFKAKITEKINELLDPALIDENRIAAEVTMYADKIAVDEELVRLKTHIKSMKDILTKGGDVGRNLDFLAQEMNREANTILSKSGDIEVKNCGIELKTCIEKIREQVQNIE